MMDHLDQDQTSFPSSSGGPRGSDQSIRLEAEVVAESELSMALHEQEAGAALFKWSLTSCLTINAGALVAVVNASSFDPVSRMWAGIFFLCGLIVSIFATLIVAYSLLERAKIRISRANVIKVSGKIDDMGSVGEYNHKRENFLSKVDLLAGLVCSQSLIAFFVGAWLMIEGAK